MRQRIIDKPSLDFLDVQKLFEVKCDASGMAINFFLKKEERGVAYFSEKLNDAKKKYSS